MKSLSKALTNVLTYIFFTDYSFNCQNFGHDHIDTK